MKIPAEKTNMAARKKNALLFLYGNLFIPFVLMAIFTLSCGSAVETQADVKNNEGENFVSESESVAAPGEEARPGRRMILKKGNYWVKGIPGFGDNGFPALFGEYEFEGLSSPSSGNSFSVRLTSAALFFSDDWQTMSGGSGARILEQGGEEGFIAALVIDDRAGTFWTVVFDFTVGLEEAGLDPLFFDRVMRAWTARFSYYLFQSESREELSLPASADF